MRRRNDLFCTGNAEFRRDYAVKNFDDKANGWRIFNIDGLKSIVEKRFTESVINLQAYSQHIALIFFGRLPEVGDPDYANNIYFGRGLVGNDLKINSFYARLVKGEQWRGDSGTSGK